MVKTQLVRFSINTTFFGELEYLASIHSFEKAISLSNLIRKSEQEFTIFNLYGQSNVARH